MDMNEEDASYLPDILSEPTAAATPEQSTKRKRGRPRKNDTTPRPQQSKKVVVKVPEDDPYVDQPEDVEASTDPKGELKIDDNGYLKGGREYTVRTLTLPRHPKKLYMLTMDVSKALNFRDSYIFYLKNPHIQRIHGNHEDKEYLIEKGYVPSQLRSRNVALLTARSVFREFGYKIVRRGRPILDDYWVGDRNEEDAPEYVEEKYEAEISQDQDDPYSLRRSGLTNVGPRAISLVTPQFTAAAVTEQLVSNTSGRVLVLSKAAASAAEFNSRLRAQRTSTFFDMHTNLDLFPKITQPSEYLVEMNPLSNLSNEVFVQKGLHLQNRKRKPDNDEIDVVELKDEIWIPVQKTEDSIKYPLALIHGQYQGSTSLYIKRFSREDARAAAIEFAAEAERVRKEQELAREKEREKDAEEDPMEILDLVITDQNLNQLVCGDITKNGTECRRPVVNVGDRCSHHDPRKLGPCVYCHEIEAPPPKEEEPDAPHIPSTIMLTCSVCRLRHHPICIEMDDIVLISKVQKYDWHCSSCKMCTTCNEAGDEAKMLFCDTCDRGYHMYCLKPPLDKLPDGAWLCTQCAKCTSCGKTSAPIGRRIAQQIEWKHVIVPSDDPAILSTYLCTYCSPCFEHFESDRFCPLCMKVYKETSEDLAMVCCDSCDRWIHVGCDPELNEDKYNQLIENSEQKFKCAICDEKKLAVILDSKKQSAGSHCTFKLVEHKGQRLVAPHIVR